jgi:hypothetical protein
MLQLLISYFYDTSRAESICLQLSQFAFSFKEEELTVKTLQNSCLNCTALKI